MNNKVLSNLFGIIGTVLWSIQLIPQIHLNYKRKSTKGVSPTCFGCWYACGIVLGTNLVFNREPPALVVQISCFSLFCLVIVMQHLFYQKKYNLKRLSFTLGLCLLVTAATIISIYSILNAKRTNGFVVQLLIAIVATSLMTVGFLPQVLEVYQEKVGLSKIFVVMDFFGGVFSILSLVFYEPFDYMSFSTYVVVPIFQAIILILIIRITWRTGINSSISSPIIGSLFENNNNNNNQEEEDRLNSIDLNENDLNKGNGSGNIYHNDEIYKGGGSILSGGAQDEESYIGNGGGKEYHNIPLISGSGGSFKETHNHILKESLVIPSSSIMESDDDNHDSHEVQEESPSHPPQPQRQELDHVIPLSISHTAELLIKQQQSQQLAQQQALVDESINQLRNNIINNHHHLINNLNNLNNNNSNNNSNIQNQNQNCHSYPNN